jgi:hypothetical protein
VSKLILLVVAAAWAAVLLPPLLRSRWESRPGSSVSSFRRQLSSLQRSTPGGNMAQMRSMARPLTSAPRPGAVRSVPAPGRSPYAAQPMPRSASGRPAVGLADRYDLRTARPLERRSANQGQRRATVARRASVRQRRQNVLFLLVLSTVVTGVLALATHATAMKFALAAAATMLVVYIYMLAQSRRLEDERSMRDMWDRAI